VDTEEEYKIREILHDFLIVTLQLAFTHVNPCHSGAFAAIAGSKGHFRSDLILHLL
jgi:hypothetical protein